MRAADRRAVELALVQCGAFARWQLEGVGADAIRRRVADGTWLRRHPGVYVLPSAPATFEQRVWAAWLAVGPDSKVSHEAAAQLRSVPNVRREEVTLLRDHSGQCRINGAFVHQISDVLPHHFTLLDGLPVTTVARTIVDLAAVVLSPRLHAIVEDSKHARLTTYAEIGTVLTEVARRGKPGVRSLTRVLDRLTATKGLSQSRLESALIDLLQRAGLTDYELQFPHPGRLFTSGCVDVSFVRAKVITEIDGRTWHTRIREVKRDHDRDNDAARHGWQTLRLLHEHVIGDPIGTISLLADVLRVRTSGTSTQ